MLKVTAGIEIPDAEFEWAYSRAGGPGGQNVNKVASKAQLRWHLASSPSLAESVKARLRLLHPSMLTTEGELLISSQKYRDQERNRHDCLAKLAAIIRQAATVPKARRPTKPTKGSQRRRLEEKKRQSARKGDRKVGGGE